LYSLWLTVKSSNKRWTARYFLPASKTARAIFSIAVLAWAKVVIPSIARLDLGPGGEEFRLDVLGPLLKPALGKASWGPRFPRG